MAPTIGMDIGGTNVRGAIVAEDGTVVHEEHRATPHGWDALSATLLEVVATLRAVAPDVDAIGIGIAALVDFDGRIHYAPNIPGLIDLPLRGSLAQATGLPVVVDNDANVAAWGEASFGAAVGVRDCLVITLGTGVGGGIIADGALYRGGHGFAAEIGHFTVDPDGPLCACGERGHWEAIASGTALGRMGREAAAAGEAPRVLAAAGGVAHLVTGRDVTDAVLAGAPDALAILERFADNVALGLAGLANILDPSRIVVSGGLIELGETLLAPVRRSFAGRIEGADLRPTPDIVAATLGERAGVIGAAALARRAGRDG
jgi:glucokinase